MPKIMVRERFAHWCERRNLRKACRRFGLNDVKVILSVSSMICFKECDDMQLVSLAVKDGLPISERAHKIRFYMAELAILLKKNLI